MPGGGGIGAGQGPGKLGNGPFGGLFGSGISNFVGGITWALVPTG